MQNLHAELYGLFAITKRTLWLVLIPRVEKLRRIYGEKKKFY